MINQGPIKFGAFIAITITIVFTDHGEPHVRHKVFKIFIAHIQSRCLYDKNLGTVRKERWF